MPKYQVSGEVFSERTCEITDWSVGEILVGDWRLKKIIMETENFIPRGRLENIFIKGKICLCMIVFKTFCSFFFQALT